MFDLSIKILVVDDMVSFRKMLISHLNEIGFSKIDEAGNGKIALEMMQSAQQPYDLVISDWIMPELTGIELLKVIRKDEKFKNIPCILVTTEHERHQIIKAVEAGVDSFIVKPFDREILVQKMEDVHKKLAAPK